MNTCLHKHKIISISLFLIAFLISGCAARPYLIVDYHIQPRRPNSKVKNCASRSRTSAPIPRFTPAAAQQFEGFEGRYSLAWVSGDRNRILAGEHDLSSLFLETFKKRLQQMGVAVVSNDRSRRRFLSYRLKPSRSTARPQVDSAYEL